MAFRQYLLKYIQNNVKKASGNPFCKNQPYGEQTLDTEYYQKKLKLMFIPCKYVISEFELIYFIGKNCKILCT